jgi:hypothetical protein
MTAGDEVTEFRSSRGKHLVFCAFTVLFGLYCFKDGSKFPPMYVFGGVSGFLSLVFAWEVVARRAVLKLDRQGFECHLALDKRVYTWTEADEFEAGSYGVYFRMNGSTDRFLPNFFEATAEEIQDALTLYRSRYGGTRSTSPAS